MINPSFGIRTISGVDFARKEAGGWWLVTGKTCVGAWQAKGAASLAASYTDLTGNGYNAAPGVAPTWDVTNGWKFNGTTQYLTTGLDVSTNTTETFLVRLSNFVVGGNAIGIYGGAANKRLQIAAAFTSVFNYGNGNLFTSAQALGSGVAGIASTDAYFNGSDVGDITTGLSHTDDIYFGCLNSSGSPDFYGQVYIQAVAIYSSTLTAGEVATVSTAMNAL